MPQLPTPLRAAIGFAAEAVDQARHLPDRAIELPMLAVSTALQLSLRAQQRYAQLAARGDELLNRTAPTDEPPPWATFDEPVPDAPIDLTVVGAPPAADVADVADQVVHELVDEEVPAPRKRIRKPRNAAPSRFDAVGDD